MKPFSRITIGLAILIIVSASFMLQLRNYLVATFGDDAVKLGFSVLFSLIMLSYLSYIFYKRVPVQRIALSLIVFEVAYLLISCQPFFAEKLHVLEYGILGYLALRDLFKTDKHLFRDIIYVLCFVLLVGSLDEGFQWFLPYRMFEVRDIVTNVLSGSLGIIKFLICRHHVI